MKLIKPSRRMFLAAAPALILAPRNADAWWQSIQQIGISGGGPPVVVSDTWNPSDKNANIVLTNGNLTASTPDFAFELVRSVGKKANGSGKYYVEFSFDANSNAYAAVGFDDGTTALNGQLYSSGSVALAAGGGQLNTNASYSGYNLGRDLTTGDIVMFALDTVANKVYAGVNGAYLSNPATMNPSTSTNGAPISALAYYLAANTVQDTITLRATAASFSYSIPIGYTPWST